MFTILIVDSRVIVRSGLKQILSNRGIARRVDEAEAVAGAEILLRNRAYDVVLIRLGSQQEAEVLTRSMSTKSEPLAGAKILLFGREGDVRRAMPLLRAGAAGYLSENSATDQILVAVRSAASGDRYLSPMLADPLIAERSLDGRLPPQTKPLSSQESAVLNLLSHGLRAAEIAESLRISVESVNTYKTRICKKTGVRNKAEMIRYAIEHETEN